MNIKRKNLNELFISTLLKVRLEIKVMAITIMVMGDAIPAETDASPKTMAPRMDMADP